MGPRDTANASEMRTKPRLEVVVYKECHLRRNLEIYFESEISSDGAVAVQHKFFCTARFFRCTILQKNTAVF